MVLGSVTSARRRAAAAAVAVLLLGTSPSWAGGPDIAPLVVKPGAPIHFTGVGTESGENSCTMAFLFTATVPERSGRHGRIRQRSVDYASTAGHCVLVDPTATEEVHAPGEGPVVHLTQRGTDGALVAGPRIGRVVYAGSVMPVLYPDERLPELMDLAMIELDPGVVSDPSLCHFGGPTALRQTPLDGPEDVHLYGNGNATGLNRETGVTLLPARTGPAVPFQESAVSMATASSGGDSGSPLIDADGQALALLTGPYQPRIAPMLGRVQEVLGIRLSLRTAPLVENAPPFGADPACAPL